MMTPKQATEKYGNAPTLDKEYVMGEIQRDAREGMVRMEDWHEPSNSRLHLEAEATVRRYHDFAQTHNASDNKAELTAMLIAMCKFARQGTMPNSAVKRLIDNMNSAAERIIAEAREGMVPVEDVRPILEALDFQSNAINETVAIKAWMRTAMAFEQFRAKHPELFPK